MVDLVLDAGRHQTVGLDLPGLAVEVHVADLDHRRALDLLVVLGDRQAALFIERHLLRFPGDLRIEKDDGASHLVLLGQINGDDALGDADLDCGKADAGSVIHGVEHIGSERADIRRHGSHWFRHPLQLWVRQNYEGLDGHGWET